jgi:GNAT superfamily N-acetyltransferase
VTIQLFHADTDEQIAVTFDVMQQLRPHLQRPEFVPLIRSLMASDELRLLALADNGVIRAVASYRVMTMLYCGRMLYIDDLVSDEQSRSQGYGAQLIARLKDEARALGCNELQLISRVTREQAHRFYFREGFGIECFQFRAKLT